MLVNAVLLAERTPLRTTLLGVESGAAGPLADESTVRFGYGEVSAWLVCIGDSFEEGLEQVGRVGIERAIGANRLIQRAAVCGVATRVPFFQV